MPVEAACPATRRAGRRAAGRCRSRRRGRGSVALVAAGHPFGDRLQRAAAHDVGGAGEQHLDLGVVERGGVVGEPAVALEVEVLPVIVGQAVGLGGRAASRRRACRAGAHRPAAGRGNRAGCGAGTRPAPARAGAGAGRGRHRCPAIRAWNTARMSAVSSARAGRRPDGEIGLGHGLQEAAAGGIVAGIPGDPRGLAGGIGEAIEGGNHVGPISAFDYSALCGALALPWWRVDGYIPRAFTERTRKRPA